MEFIDLSAQRKRLGVDLDSAILAVLEGGHYILGPEVAELELALANRTSARHAITCASGTDALMLVLMAWGISAGDAVLVPAFTFAATAEVVSLLGATPVFVDVDPVNYNLDPLSVARTATKIAEGPLRPAAVIAVDLFGQPADYGAIATTARHFDMRVLSDAAQSFGASRSGVSTGAMGVPAATSFFPAKPLGCYGDGGAVFTDDDELAAIVRSLRVHGQGDDKYDNVRVGINSRLDTVQAAVLLAKLRIFNEEVAQRQLIANRYGELLRGVAEVPVTDPGTVSAWAQYTIKLNNRDQAAVALRKAGIPSAVYYPKALSEQVAFLSCPTDPAGLPVSAELGKRVLSLPMHPYLSVQDQERVAAVLLEASVSA